MSRSSQSHLVTSQWKRVRLRVLMRDGRTCAYCGQGDANEVDHVIPISKGGDVYDLDNLVACCRRCNNAKGALTNAVFLSRSATPPVLQTLTSPLTTSTLPNAPIATINDSN